MEFFESRTSTNRPVDIQTRSESYWSNLPLTFKLDIWEARREEETIPLKEESYWENLPYIRRGKGRKHSSESYVKKENRLYECKHFYPGNAEAGERWKIKEKEIKDAQKSARDKWLESLSEGELESLFL